MSTNDDLLKQLSAELADAPTLELAIDAVEAYRLCALLQLAMRHPAVRDDGDLRGLVEKLIAVVGGIGPAVAETLAMGWQTGFDREH